MSSPPSSTNSRPSVSPPRRYTNLPAIQLAKKLATLAPGNLNKVLFAPGGTSAIGMALKLARAATGRHRIQRWATSRP